MTKETSPTTKSSSVVVYAPLTVEAQRGGTLYDRTTVSLSTSRYIPHRLVELSILLAEVYFLNIPEWIFGEKNLGRPPVEKRIESSVAASRVAIEDTVSKGGRRKVAVLTGGASGLGYMTAMSVAEAGYHLIIGENLFICFFVSGRIVWIWLQATALLNTITASSRFVLRGKK